jgi:uroporphyrinogen decarboxylase
MSDAPNVERLVSVLRHEGVPGPVPFVELFADQQIMEAVLGHPMIPPGLSRRPAKVAHADSLIAFYRKLGYAYVPVSVGSGLRRETASAADTAPLSKGERHWDNAATGSLRTWADFEAYPWPKPGDLDYTEAEYLLAHLPEGMGAMAMGGGGVLEWVMWLMSYEGFAVALYDAPELVAALFQRVIETLLVPCRNLMEMGQFVGYFVGDDMGYATATMVSPAVMRQYVFPGQRQLTDVVHAHGLPFVLHSCGNLSAVMEDLIVDVRIDAKHSFEDKIEPVESVHARYGQRISLLGGVDVDLLTRGSEAQVRARTRQLLDLLGPSGTWALGTGNSVTNYIPVRNYLAMLDEGRLWNAEYYG